MKTDANPAVHDRQNAQAVQAQPAAGYGPAGPAPPSAMAAAVARSPRMRAQRQAVRSVFGAVAQCLPKLKNEGEAIRYFEDELQDDLDAHVDDVHALRLLAREKRWDDLQERISYQQGLLTSRQANSLHALWLDFSNPDSRRAILLRAASLDFSNLAHLPQMRSLLYAAQEQGFDDIEEMLIQPVRKLEDARDEARVEQAPERGRAEPLPQPLPLPRQLPVAHNDAPPSGQVVRAEPHHALREIQDDEVEASDESESDSGEVVIEVVPSRQEQGEVGNAPRGIAPAPRLRRRGLRGVGRRLKRKALRGRTFGDMSNAVGSISNLIGPDENENPVPAASALVAIGGLGVLLNGLKLVWDGAREYRGASTSRQSREALYTLCAGIYNIESGAAGMISGIASLAGAYSSGSLAGVASTAAWAVSELINIFAQLDVIIRKFNDGPSRMANLRRHWKAILKASLALLASLVKGAGAVLSLYVAVAKSLGEDVDSESSFAAHLMVIGAGISVLQGIVKLCIMCGVEFTSFEEVPPDSDGSGSDDEPEDDDDEAPRGGRDLELGAMGQV